MRKFLSAIIVFVIISCNNSDRIEQKQYKINGNKLKCLMEQTDTINNQGVSDTISIEGLIDNKLCFVYLLDASCSSCIGDYFHFINSVKALGLNTAIYGVCNESYEDIIFYYIEKVGYNEINKHSSMLFISEEYPYNLNPRKNVLIVKNKVVIRSFLYASGRIFD